MPNRADPIVGAFQRLARRRPERPLVIGREVWTIGETAHLTDGVTRHLSGMRLPPGSLVVQAIPNGPAFLACWVALRRLGIVPVLTEQSGNVEEQRRLAARLGAGAVITAPTWASRPAEFRLARVPSTVETEPTVVSPEMAAVKLTSGTTAGVRGVLAPAAALVADDDALSRTMGIAPDERVLAAVPMAHSYGFSSVALPALRRGTQLVVPDARHPLDGLRLVRSAGVTFLPTSPAFLDALLRTAHPPPRPPELRLVISAGAPLPPSVAARFESIYGLPVHVFYGASECGGITYDRTGESAKNGTVGTPIEGVQLWLGAAVTPHAPHDGIVHVRSPAVAARYVPEPAVELDDGRFVTGDIARWEGDEIRLCGRLDDLINLRGRKVNPRQVERILLRHELVRDAAVLAVGNGPSALRIRAYVVADRDCLNRQKLIEWCRSHLADHEVPRSFVLLDVLPRTVRGKPDRQALLSLTPEQFEHTAIGTS